MKGRRKGGLGFSFGDQIRAENKLQAHLGQNCYQQEVHQAVGSPFTLKLRLGEHTSFYLLGPSCSEPKVLRR